MYRLESGFLKNCYPSLVFPPACFQFEKCLKRLVKIKLGKLCISSSFKYLALIPPVSSDLCEELLEITLVNLVKSVLFRVKFYLIMNVTLLLLNFQICLSLGFVKKLIPFFATTSNFEVSVSSN